MHTCSYKVQVEALHKTNLLCSQVTLVSRQVHGVNALKEARQRRDLVLVGSKRPSHLQLHSLEFRHAIGGAKIVEHVHHLLKHGAGAIECGDGVIKVRGLLVLGNHLKLQNLLLHGLSKSVFEVGWLGGGKRRKPKFMSAPVLKKRIGVNLIDNVGHF